MIAIDAADNSVAAALRPNPQDPCFVHELVQADVSSLPPNVRFVVSTRTARKPSLKLPTGTPEIICHPFELAETKAFVTRLLDNVSEIWIEQFHALSHGVPRVQDYAFSVGKGDSAGVLDALRPGGKHLADVLRQLFQVAMTRTGNVSSYNRLVSSLAVLPAPVPIRHLSAVSCVPEDELADFIGDIQPSLRRDPEGISIADEDVEDFIHDEGRAEIADATDRACSYFSGIYKTDTYAAIHYADILHAAERAAEILPIIEADLAPTAISDPVARREVQLRRLRLSLAACRSAENAVASAKVLLLSAEAAKDEAVLADLLEKSLDLSIQFARSSVVRRILTDSDRAKRQGPVLVQDAARAARSGDHVQAREQLHFFSVWMQRRSAVSEKEQDGWRITDDDLIARSEAIALLAGPKQTVRDLKRWSPNDIPIRVLSRLLPLLVKRGNIELVKAFCEKKALPDASLFLAIVPLTLAGNSIDKKTLKTALDGLSSKHLPTIEDTQTNFDHDSWKADVLDSIVTACEIGFVEGVSRKTIKTALQLITKFNKKLNWSSYRIEAEPLDKIVRCWLLYRTLNNKSTSLDDFLAFAVPTPTKRKPANGRQKKKQSHQTDERDNEKRKYVRTVYPVYLDRLGVLVAASKGNTPTEAQIQAISGFSESEYIFERDHNAQSYRAATSASILNLMHIVGISIPSLYEKASTLANTRYHDPYAHRILPLLSLLLLRSDQQSFVLGKILEKSELTKAERAPASDKVSALIEFSRLVLNFSKSDAQILFEEAVARAQEIDIEAINQIEVLSALAAHHQNWDQATCKRLTRETFRFISDSSMRLDDHEHFPWQAAVKTMVGLHQAAALAAIARWSDEGIKSHEENLRYFLQEVSVKGVSYANFAVPLLPLLDDVSSKLIDRIISASKDFSTHSATIDLLCSDHLLNISSVQTESRLKELVSQICRTVPPAAGPNVERLKCTADFIAANQHPEVEQDEQDKSSSADPILNLSGRRIILSSEIGAALAEARAMKKYYSIEGALKQIQSTISAPGDRAPYLDGLVGLNDVALYEPARTNALLDAAKSWNDTPSVKRWLFDNLKTYIVQHFADLARTSRFEKNYISQLFQAAGYSTHERQQILMEGAEKTALTLASRTLFVVAEEVATTLDPAEALAIFEWYVSRLDKKVADRTLDFKAADLPDEIVNAVGRFLFSLLTDADTRIRWKAVHAVRRLAALNQQAAVLAVFENYDRQKDELFRDPQAPHYWMAGRLWCVISSARIAVENSDILAPIGSKLVDIALDESFPHILIQEFARQAALSLIESGVLSVSQKVSNALENVNKGGQPARKPPKNRIPTFSWEDQRGRPFKYGHDTIEYWHSHAVRLFSRLDKTAYLDELERWLLNVWGVPADANYWDREPRRGRLSHNSNLQSSSHGGLPVQERYGTYVEWHGMFLAIGSLMKDHSLATKDSIYGSLKDWMSDYTLSMPPVWISDLRSPKPLHKNLWFESKQADSYWLRSIAIKDVIQNIMPEGASSQSCLTVHGDWTEAFPTREVRVGISSGLVSPATAISLVRALQTSGFEYGYEFPFENDDYQITNGNCTLNGWLLHVRGRDGLDKKDPIRHGLSAVAIRPGKKLSSSCLQNPKTPVNLHWLSVRGEGVGARFCTWADLPESFEDHGHRQRRRQSNGSIFQINVETLYDFLNSQNRDLILGVRIERRIEKEYGRSYDSDPKQRKAFQNFFIFRKNGTIEDYRRVIGPWRSNRRGSQP